MTTKGHSRFTLLTLGVSVSQLGIASIHYSLFIKHLLYLSYVLLGVGDIMVNKT